MPALSDYTAGTITLTNGSVNFTGAGTGWQAADFREGDTILGIEDNAGVEYVIASITGNGAGTLTQEWGGATGTYTYRMRYLADGARVTAQARNLIELLGNGNVQALAGLTGPGVPVFNGPHSMAIKPEADFINGVAYDVQVDTIADRAAYDGQSEGFAVLVSDVGDGRSALFSKASNTSGDWTDPAYITGPSVAVTVGTTTEGPFGGSPDVTGVTGAGSLQLNFELPGSPSIDATVSNSPPGTTASVVTTPVTGGYELDFTLPEASGFYNAGVYDVAEAYSQDDVVRHNGSSFIALQAVPAGISPSNASPPVDTAYWQVLAAKGADGAGTGDVVGPSGAVADRIAVFDGTTGKLIKDGGKTLAEVVPANNSITNAILADMAVNTIKGRIASGTGDPQDLTAAQALEIVKTAGAYAKDNILGTVSETAGVPSGAIIERGSNANGEYVKFADGTMECLHTFTLTYLTDSYFRGSWDFPAAFMATPKVFGSIAGSSGYSPSDRSAFGVFWVDASGLTASGAQYVDIVRSWGAPNIVAGNTVTVNALAKGRWF